MLFTEPKYRKMFLGFLKKLEYWIWIMNYFLDLPCLFYGTAILRLDISMYLMV